jgi:carbonic anhydrase
MSQPAYLGRRQALLTMLGAGAAVACPLCRAVAEDKAVHAAPHWTYEGAAGPEAWGGLSADFRVCSLGLEQTPIDLSNPVHAQTGLVVPTFQPMPLTILNNGHTIQVNCPPGSRTTISDESFELLQFHFHHPSEHLLAGRPFEMELHFVHKSAAGRLAVLGVFIRLGRENPALASIWAAMPDKAGEPTAIGTSVDPAGLLPVDRQYFRYHGSLTTPPCSEGVLWTVYRDPIEASESQIRRFAALFPVNARPVQSLNSRFLLDSL